MGDKYNSLKKDVYRDSTYQMLVEPRNKALEKVGAKYYNVVDSKTVEHNGDKKDCQIFYDTEEFYTINDRTDNDTWGGQTTTAVVTINTLEKPGDLETIKLQNKLKEQLENAINNTPAPSPSPEPEPEPEPVTPKTWKTANFNAKDGEDNTVECYYALNISSLDESETKENVESFITGSELSIENNVGFALTSLSDEYTIENEESSDISLTSVSLPIVKAATSENVGSLSLTLKKSSDDTEITDTLSITEKVEVAVSEVQ